MKYVIWVIILLALIKSCGQRSEFVKISKMDIDQTRADRFLALLREVGITNEEVVLAQAILETANFKSKIAMENKNHFGMKYNTRGWAKGTMNGHAYYDDEIDSYYDYKAWQDNAKRNYGPDLTTDEYLKLLNSPYKDRRRYAEDPLYTAKLKFIIKKIRACCTVAPRPQPLPL